MVLAFRASTRSSRALISAGPRGLSVGVDLGFETLNQLAGESSTLFIGEPKRLDEQLSGVHESRLSRALGLRCCSGNDRRSAASRA